MGMIEYQTLARVSFNAGQIIGLSADQAGARASRLEPVGKSKTIFRATGPIEFKAGETIRLPDDPLSRTMAEKMQGPEAADDETGAGDGETGDGETGDGGALV